MVDDAKRLLPLRLVARVVALALAQDIVVELAVGDVASLVLEALVELNLLITTGGAQGAGGRLLLLLSCRFAPGVHVLHLTWAHDAVKGTVSHGTASAESHALHHRAGEARQHTSTTCLGRGSSGGRGSGCFRGRGRFLSAGRLGARRGP